MFSESSEGPQLNTNSPKKVVRTHAHTRARAWCGLWLCYVPVLVIRNG